MRSPVLVRNANAKVSSNHIGRHTLVLRVRNELKVVSTRSLPKINACGISRNTHAPVFMLYKFTVEQFAQSIYTYHRQKCKANATKLASVARLNKRIVKKKNSK